MFQQPSSIYAPGFPGRPMKGKPGDKLMLACWERDLAAFQEALANELSDRELEDEEEALERLPENHVDEHGNTFVHVAVYRGSTRIIKHILESCPAARKWIQSKTHHGITPLHYSCRRNRTAITKTLLQRGADARARDLNGNTPLHFAVEAGSLEVVEFFLAHKLPFDMSNAGGATPLLIACRDNLRKIAFILASAGADICKANTTGNSPLQLARAQGWGEDLRRAGAVPEQPVPPEMMRMDDESAMFAWTAPAGRSAPVQHFRLQAKKIDRLDPDAPWQTVADCVKERRHTFYTCAPHCSTYPRDPRPEDLAPSEVYAVRVLAYSIVGWSEPSEQSRMFVTSPAAPGRPNPPIMIRADRASITVRWELPESNGAPVDRSELQWRLANTPYGTWSSVPEKLIVHEASIPDDEAPSSSESDTDDEEDPLKRAQIQEFTLTGLSRDAAYIFRVRCHNLMGWSYYSVPSIKANTRARERNERRAGLGAHQDDTTRRAFRGTATHAQARFMAFSLANANAEKQAQMEAELAARSDLARRQEAASIQLQTFWRARRAAWKYHTYLRDRVVRKNFLVEYSLEIDFVEQWRRHLLRFVLEAEATEKEKQKILDARRKRKIARTLRRERRQLVRKQRAVQREQQHAARTLVGNSHGSLETPASTV